LTITTKDPLTGNIHANLVTTLNSKDGNEWDTVPFVRDDAHTLVYRVTPIWSGLNPFRAGFSMDKGTSWLRDSVPDAWVLIDPPQVDGLCLYTMIPNVSGSLTDCKDDLERIREMGFNAILTDYHAFHRGGIGNSRVTNLSISDWIVLYFCEFVPVIGYI
jgi:hypothetical protein